MSSMIGDLRQTRRQRAAAARPSFANPAKWRGPKTEVPVDLWIGSRVQRPSSFIHCDGNESRNRSILGSASIRVMAAFSTSGLERSPDWCQSQKFHVRATAPEKKGKVGCQGRTEIPCHLPRKHDRETWATPIPPRANLLHAVGESGALFDLCDSEAERTG